MVRFRRSGELCSSRMFAATLGKDHPADLRPLCSDAARSIRRSALDAFSFSVDPVREWR